MIIHRVFPVVFSLMALISCHKKESDLIVLDLTQQLGTKMYQSSELPSLEVVSELDIDSEIPIGGYARVFYCSDTLYGINDDTRLYFFDRSSGKLFSDLTHVGRGPSEYLYPSNISVRDTIVCISDKPEVGKAVFYSINGNYIRTEQIPVNSIYEFLGSDNYAIVYNNHEDELLEIFNNAGTSLRKSLIDDGPKETTITYTSQIKPVNGEYTIKPALRDTIFHITLVEDIPRIVLDKGKLVMPDEYQSTFNTWSDNQGRYITLDACHIAGDLAFVMFNYDDKEHHEIWDIRKRKLLFKSYLHRDNIFSFGPKVELSDETIPFWPSSVFGSDMFCVWGDEKPRVVQVRARRPE